ncbi:MAG: type II toxin-antitoxin system HicA family toxin [Elusimicrobia bacterium]|nr:type II toxin-antitoxin system HicA family toxin [Elusimicrobiota bacterium]
MSARFPRLKAREIIRVLRTHGFLLAATKGSHQKWRNNATEKQVIVPYHAGKELPLGTLKSIIEGSGIPLEDWE